MHDDCHASLDIGGAMVLVHMIFCFVLNIAGTELIHANFLHFHLKFIGLGNRNYVC
jgi:hypothetical protein